MWRTDESLYLDGKECENGKEWIKKYLKQYNRINRILWVTMKEMEKLEMTLHFQIWENGRVLRARERKLDWSMAETANFSFFSSSIELELWIFSLVCYS